MTVRRVSFFLICLGGLAYVVPAEARPVAQFVRNAARDFKRNNCWPEPFLCPDRQSVRAPLGLMVHNGWLRQNMIADHHFQEGSSQLTEAGERKVRWIINQAPKHHRAIFVHTAETAEETAARIDVVQQLAIRLLPEGELPPVMQTNLDAGGWPAERVDAIDRKFRDTTPDPRLPELQSGGGATD